MFLRFTGLPFFILVSFVVLAPLPLGSNRAIWWQLEALAVALMWIFCFGIALLWPSKKSSGKVPVVATESDPTVISSAKPSNNASSLLEEKRGSGNSGNRKRFRIDKFLFISCLCWFGLLSWILIQAWVGPNQIWPGISVVLESGSPNLVNQPRNWWLPASANVAQTLDSFIRLAMYGLIFLSTYVICARRGVASRFLAVLAYASALYGVYGLIEWQSGNERILWMKKYAYEGVVTSTFINRNSYATYAALGVLCSLAMFLRELKISGTRAVTMRQIWIDAISSGFGPSSRFIICALIGIIAIFATQSRGGLLGLVFGVGALAMLTIIATTRRFEPTAIVVPMVAVIVLGLPLVYAGDETLLRMIEALDHSGDGTRWVIYAKTWDGILSYPWGTGSGTFIDVYPSLRGSETDVSSNYLIDKAHNTYLETLLELGVIGTLLVLGAFLSIMLKLGIDLRRGDRPWYGALGLSSICLIGAHSWLDFSVQIPAVAIMFAAVLGIAASGGGANHSVSRRSSSSSTSPY